MGRGAVRRVVLAGLATASATACTFLYDTDELRQEPQTCGALCDASPVGDAPSDTADAAKDVATDVVASRHGCRDLGSVTFCRDFDDGSDFSAGFNIQSQQGSLFADSNASYSPSSSFVAAIMAGDGTVARFSDMYRQFNGAVGGGARDIRIAANIQLKDYAPGDTLAVLGLVFGGTADLHSIILEMGDQHADITEIQQNTLVNRFEFPSGKVPPVGSGAWPRIEIHMTFAPPHLTATLDTGSGPTTVVDGNLGSSLWQTPYPPQFHIGIGRVVTAGPAWSVRYDDVVLDLK